MNTKALYKITNLVKEILEENIQARNSDTYLYLQVIYKVGLLKGINMNEMSVTDFLLRRSSLNFPNYETVSRVRRKLQAEHPELTSSKEVKAQKLINERVYRDYAKSKSIKIGE
jgi:hypothetical protein